MSQNPPNDWTRADDPTPSKPGAILICGKIELNYLLGWWSLNVPPRALSGKLPDGTPFQGATSYMVIGTNYPDGATPDPNDSNAVYQAILVNRYHVDQVLFTSKDQRSMMSGERPGTEADQIAVARGIMKALRLSLKLDEDHLEELLVRGDAEAFSAAIEASKSSSIHTRVLKDAAPESHFPGIT